MKGRRLPELIVALDVPTVAEAVRVARRVRPLVRTVKIGSALFTRSGPDAVRRLRALGLTVMLDLKFFDIPSTVARSVRAAVAHRVGMLTVHAQGGDAMLRAAVSAARIEAARLGVPRPLILGVTVLTSVGSGRSRGGVAARVLSLAREAVGAGCDGVVASVREAPLLRRRLGRRVKLFCPGIRPQGAGRGDQARVASPGQAVSAGVNALIVGRPITQADDPAEATRDILSELEGTTCR